MKWAELSIRATKPTEEILANLLCEEGAEGTIFSTDRTGRIVVSGFLPVNTFLEGRMRRIRQRLRNLYREDRIPTAKVVLRHHDEEDWAEAWKEHFRIERITDQFVICPGWLRSEYRPRPGDLPIYIDPGMAFGTGTHPTTVLCVKALERHLRGGELTCDVGTGSGILAIAAVKLGARRVLALDIDETACTVARENIESNGVQARVEVRQNDLLSGIQPDQGVGVVVANIIMEVIRDMLPDVEEILRPGGLFIVSGITLEKLEPMYSALEGRNLNVVEDHRRGEWAALILRKGAN